MNRLLNYSFLVVFFAALVSLEAKGQQWEWAQKAGGASNDLGNGIAVDASGNSYVTGHFRDTVTFGSTTLISSGNDDIFIAKYDASGTVLWAQKAGGTDLDKGFGIAVDASGNSYVTGSFRGTSTFGSTTLTSSGNNDIFVAKYDSSGAVLWAENAGGSSIDNAYGIAVDSLGNSYITGEFRGSAIFGSTSLTSSGNYDVFVAKYDSSGTVLWARGVGGTSIDRGYGIAVDASGNSYVTGQFTGTTTFGLTILTSSGGRDIFVVKYDASSAVLWAQNAGGTFLMEVLA